MEGVPRNGEAIQRLDSIATQREWLMKISRDRIYEEKSLELRLGLPGDNEEWSNKQDSAKDKSNVMDRKDRSILSLGFFSTRNNCGVQDGQNFAASALSPLWPFSVNYPATGKAHQQVQFSPSISQTQLPVFADRESSSQHRSASELADLQNNNAEKKKAFSPASAANTAVPNSSQKRTAPAPVVGWPPLRTFRKNITSSSHGKSASESQNPVSSKTACEKPVESCRKGLFVKINMDGVPIGRKVDLKAYDSYDKLSVAIDELFRGLLAAQKNTSAGGIQDTPEEEERITGLLDSSGEYTLVYEDYEGDRMLVGDVPWHMFVSTAKRLRVLKRSELPLLSLGGKKQDKM